MENKESIWAESLIDSLGNQEKHIPSKDVFEKVLEELDHSYNRISLKWVGIAAALIIGLFIGEFSIIENNEESQAELLEIIPESSNTIYYE